MDEIQLYGMRGEDPLRRQLISQRDISFPEVERAFLRIDQGRKVSAAVESANLAAVGCYYICRLVGHMAMDCPHTAAIDRLVSDRSRTLGSNQEETEIRTILARQINHCTAMIFAYHYIVLVKRSSSKGKFLHREEPLLKCDVIHA